MYLLTKEADELAIVYSPEENLFGLPLRKYVHAPTFILDNVIVEMIRKVEYLEVEKKLNNHDTFERVLSGLDRHESFRTMSLTYFLTVDP